MRCWRGERRIFVNNSSLDISAVWLNSRKLVLPARHPLYIESHQIPHFPPGILRRFAAFTNGPNAGCAGGGYGAVVFDRFAHSPFHQSAIRGSVILNGTGA